MSAEPRYVLDASVGVKWFRRENGSGAAHLLQQRSVLGEVQLAAPTHFVHEVLATVQRENTADVVIEAWEIIQDSGIAIIPLTTEVIAEAAVQCETLGCSFYDALAPACAVLLDARLASADARAHGAFPGVMLIGE